MKYIHRLNNECSKIKYFGKVRLSSFLYLIDTKILKLWTFSFKCHYNIFSYNKDQHENYPNIVLYLNVILIRKINCDYQYNIQNFKIFNILSSHLKNITFKEILCKK